MANKREVKKGIYMMTSDLIDTIMFKNAVNGADAEKSSELIVKALKLKSDFIARLNHIDKKSDRKAVKAYFRQFDDDFSKQLTDIVEEINKL